MTTPPDPSPAASPDPLAARVSALLDAIAADGGEERFIASGYDTHDRIVTAVCELVADVPSPAASRDDAEQRALLDELLDTGMLTPHERAVVKAVFRRLRRKQKPSSDVPPAASPGQATCPTCKSPDPDLHPLTGRDDSETRLCRDTFHRTPPAASPGVDPWEKVRRYSADRRDDVYLAEAVDAARAAERQQHTTLQRENEILRQERDAANDGMAMQDRNHGHSVALEAADAKIAALQHQIETLRQALIQFSRHASTCAVVLLPPNRPWICTCGLAAHLTGDPL